MFDKIAEMKHSLKRNNSNEQIHPSVEDECIYKEEGLKEGWIFVVVIGYFWLEVCWDSVEHNLTAHLVAMTPIISVEKET